MFYAPDSHAPKILSDMSVKMGFRPYNVNISYSLIAAPFLPSSRAMIRVNYKAQQSFSVSPPMMVEQYMVTEGL